MAIFSTMLSSSFASLNGTSQNNNDLNPAQTKDGTLSSYTNHSMTTASDISVTNDLRQQNAQTLDNHENTQSRENPKIELAATQELPYKDKLEPFRLICCNVCHQTVLAQTCFPQQEAAESIKSVEEKVATKINKRMIRLRETKNQQEADRLIGKWSKNDLSEYSIALHRWYRSSLENSSSTDDLLKIQAEYLKKMQYWYRYSIDSALLRSDYDEVRDLLMNYFEFAKINDAFVDLKLVGEVIKKLELARTGLIDIQDMTYLIASHCSRMMSNKSEDHNKNIILSIPDNVFSIPDNVSTETGIQIIEEQVMLGLKSLIDNITKSSNMKEDLKECWTSKLLCNLCIINKLFTYSNVGNNSSITNKKILKMLSDQLGKDYIKDKLLLICSLSNSIDLSRLPIEPKHLICATIRAARDAGIDISPLDNVKTAHGSATVHNTILQNLLSLSQGKDADPYMLLLSIKDTDKFGFQENLVNYLITIANSHNSCLLSGDVIQRSIILQVLIKQLLIKQKNCLRQLQEKTLKRANKINDAISNIEQSITSDLKDFRKSTLVSIDQAKHLPRHKPLRENKLIKDADRNNDLFLLTDMLKNYQDSIKYRPEKEVAPSYQEEVDIARDIRDIYLSQWKLFKQTLNHNTEIHSIQEGQPKTTKSPEGNRCINREKMVWLWGKSFFQPFYNLYRYSTALPLKNIAVEDI